MANRTKSQGTPHACSTSGTSAVARLSNPYLPLRGVPLRWPRRAHLSLVLEAQVSSARGNRQTRPERGETLSPKKKRGISTRSESKPGQEKAHKIFCTINNLVAKTLQFIMRISDITSKSTIYGLQWGLLSECLLVSYETSRGEVGKIFQVSDPRKLIQITKAIKIISNICTVLCSFPRTRVNLIGHSICSKVFWGKKEMNRSFYFINKENKAQG